MSADKLSDQDLIAAIKQRKIASMSDDQLLSMLKQRADAEKPYPMPKPGIIARAGKGAEIIRAGLQLRKKQIEDAAHGTNTAQPFLEQKQAEFKTYRDAVGDGIDWPAVAGSIGASAPFFGPLSALSGGAGAGLLRQTVGGAAGGGFLGGIMFPEEGQSSAWNVGLGALGGGAMPPLFKGLAYGGGWLGNKALNLLLKYAPKANPAQPKVIPTVRGTIRVEPMDLSALGKDVPAMKATPSVLGPEMAKRKQNLDALGFVDDAAPMRGQLTRDAAAFSKEANLAKLNEPGAPGEPIYQRYLAQDRKFQEIANSFVTKTKAKQAGAGQGERAGELGVSAIQTWWKESQKVVGKLYDDIKLKHGDVGGIKLDGLKNVADDLGDDEALVPIKNSVYNILKRRGIVDDEGNVIKDITVDQARGIRQKLNNLVTSGSLNFAKRKVVDALDDDVINAVGDDFFAQARNVARERFRQGNTKLVQQVIKENLQPNQMLNRARFASTRRLKEMKFTLVNSGPKGEQAWNEIRGQTAYELFNRGGKGTDPLGATFVDEIEKRLGKEKIDLLWPEFADDLWKFKDAVNTLRTTPTRHTINVSNSATVFLNYLSRIPGIRTVIDLPMIGARDVLEKTAQRKVAEEALNPNLLNNLAEQAYRDKIGNLISTELPGIGLSTRQLGPLLAPSVINQR